MMRKTVFLICTLLALWGKSCTKQQASRVIQDIYYANAATGGNTGANCANARALSSHVIGDDGAGNTLHLCGTITGSGGANIFTSLAAGSSGSPITLKWETGAIVQAPYFPGSNAITTVAAAIIINKNWWVVDGGSNGILQATSNGTGLTTQNSSNGLYLNAAQNTVVKNLTI